MIDELKRRDIHGVRQHRISVTYKGVVVDDYVADLFIENQVIVELKCVNALAPEHMAQCLNYLVATNQKIALLISFQNPKLEYKRIVRNF